jgi:hypothetical protein
MTWKLSGRWLSPCSCKLVCPCALGPAEPTRGWCSGVFVMDIERGSSDGVDLSGTRVAWAVDLPKDFSSGNGTARVYLDEGASAEQRRELEAIYQGRSGGPWEAVSGLVTTWLPTRTAPITIDWGDSPSASIGSFGQVMLKPVKDEAGRQTQLVNAPAWEVFFVGALDLADSHGSYWSDPEMRSWQSSVGGSGETMRFSWSA